MCESELVSSRRHPSVRDRQSRVGERRVGNQLDVQRVEHGRRAVPLCDAHLHRVPLQRLLASVFAPRHCSLIVGEHLLTSVQCVNIHQQITAAVVLRRCVGRLSQAARLHQLQSETRLGHPGLTHQAHFYFLDTHHSATHRQIKNIRRSAVAYKQCNSVFLCRRHDH